MAAGLENTEVGKVLGSEYYTKKYAEVSQADMNQFMNEIRPDIQTTAMNTLKQCSMGIGYFTNVPSINRLHGIIQQE